MMHWPFVLLALLSTTLAHDLKTQADQNEDEGSYYLPIVAESDPLDTERFDPMAQVQVNLTRPGRSRGPRRNLPRSLLEARQDPYQCIPSNYILVCPIAESNPCCPPGFPVCCHDPSDNCCPDGYFCSGLQTCCLNGAVGCGENCCPPPLVCGTVSGAQTCVNPASSTVAASISEAASTAVHGSGGGTGTGTATANPTPTQSTQDSGPNVPVIAGAVGGGVGALLLIAFFAWFFLFRKKKPKVVSSRPPTTLATPYPHVQPQMDSALPHGTSPAYPEGHAPLIMHKANHPWSPNSSSMASGYPYGNTPQGTSYGNNSTPPPGSVAGMMTMSDTGNSVVGGPGGYAPPPPEAVGPGGYVPPPAEDIPTTTSPGPRASSYYGGGGGSMGYGAPATASSSSAYAPSRQNTASVAGTMYSNAPWASGVISPSIEQQQQLLQQQQQQQQQHHQSLQQPPQHTPWTGVSTSTHDQSSSTPWTEGVSVPSHEQPLQPPPQQPWIHPGLAPSPSPMTPPPPPFSPGPGTFGAPPPDPAGGSGGGRQVAMTAPADRKAKPSGSMS